MYQFSTENILGYPVTTNSKANCVSQIVHWIENGAKEKYFVCANLHSLEMTRKDTVFEEAIKNADLITPDGVGIVIASKILGGNINDRITGSDIFLGVNSALNRKSKYTYFFLGSTEENLQTIKDKMKADFPNVRVVGTYSPPLQIRIQRRGEQLDG